jgi:hypothetical protein
MRSASGSSVPMNVANWLVSVPRFRPRSLRQRLAAQRRVHENDDYNGDNQPAKMHKKAQIFPALQLRVVENWVGHAGWELTNRSSFLAAKLLPVKLRANAWDLPISLHFQQLRGLEAWLNSSYARANPPK